MGPALTEKRQGAGELGRGQGRGGSGFGPAGSGEQGQAVAGADGLGTEGRMGSGTAARDSQDAGRGSGAGRVWEASSAPKAHPGRAQSGPVRHTDLRSGPRAEPLGRGGLVSGVRARWHVTVRARRVSGVAGRRAGRHPYDVVAGPGVLSNAQHLELVPDKEGACLPLPQCPGVRAFRVLGASEKPCCPSPGVPETSHSGGPAAFWGD